MQVISDYMINPIHTWGGGGGGEIGLGFCQTKQFLSCSLDEPNIQELQQIDAHYKQISDIKTWKNENTSEARQISNWSILNKQL